MFGLDVTYKIEHKLQLLIKGRLTSLLLRMGFPKVLYLDLYFFFCTSMIYQLQLKQRKRKEPELPKHLYFCSEVRDEF